LSFKEQEFQPFRKGGMIIETNITIDNQKVDSFKSLNEIDYQKVLNVIRRKYGYKQISENVEEERKKEIQKEKDWLEKGMEW
jgi:hypothetical protein